MKNLPLSIETVLTKDSRLLNEKEKAFIKLWTSFYLTVEGKATIPQLIKEFGKPQIIKKYAKVEVRTGSTRKPTIVVERFIDAVLKITDQIVIPNIPRKILLDIPHSGIVIEWIRHPSYKPEDMPKATKAEINADRAREYR